MPVGLRSILNYLIRGAHPVESGTNLLAALQRLVQFWENRRSLAVHDMGNLKVTLQVGNREVTVEFTDPATLDLLRQDPSSLVQEVIQMLGVGPTVGAAILENARATVQVDAIRVPFHPGAWQSEADPAVLLPEAAPWMVTETLLELDRKEKRGARRRRTKEAAALLDAIVRRGVAEKKTAGQIAKEAGLPPSTIRDVMNRQARGAAPKPPKLTPERVRTLLAASKGNAAAAARQSGIPERTLRDARARLARLEAAKTAPPLSAKDPKAKEALLAKVKAGAIPSVAARELGLAPRTARQWARDDRFGKK